MKHKSSHQFMAKMLSYQGLFVMLPYMIIKVLKQAVNPISEHNIGNLIIFLIIMLAVVLLFDYVGLHTPKLDIHSRKIMIIVCYITAVFVIILSYLTYSVWDNSNLSVIFLVGAITAGYLFIGWFYIRSEKTAHPSIEDKPLRSSAHCFVLSAFPWFLGYIWAETGIIIGCIIGLLAYPLVVLIGDKTLTETRENIVSPEKLATREDLYALTDFVVDVTKALALAFTMIILSYNGEMVLYFPAAELDPTLYWRNLMWLCLSAAMTAFVFEKMEDLIFGKFLVVLVLVCAFMQAVLSFIGYTDQWLVFSMLNGITLAGVLTFLEQKISKSPNVRVLPGTMFYVIFGLQLIALVLNNFNEIFVSLEIARIFISMGGLAYAFYRIHIESKVPDLKKKGVRFSPLGIKYYSIPEEEESKKNIQPI